MMTLFIFLFGLAIGSFINVIVYRIREKKSILFPGSFCPHCKKAIKWFDNIPLLSFIFLAGKCRHCKKPISIQYPLVELAAGLIFVWLFWYFNLSFEFFKLAIFSVFLLIIFVYDLKFYLILDRITIPAMVFAFIVNWYGGYNIFELIAAGFIGGAFFGIQYLISGGRWVGGGDIRLGALMGLMLGWQLLLVALFLAYLVGAIIGLILIAAGKKKMSSTLPFGTILAPATFIAFLYGQNLLNWYLNLVNF